MKPDPLLVCVSMVPNLVPMKIRKNVTCSEFLKLVRCRVYYNIVLLRLDIFFLSQYPQFPHQYIENSGS